MTRLSRVIEIVFLALAISFSSSNVIALDMNQPSAQANIHATHIASKFTAGTNSFGYYTNPDTKMGSYFIGSIDQRHGQIASNLTTPIIIDGKETIHPSSNETVRETDSKIETIQPVDNKTIPSVTNIYNIYNNTYITYNTSENKTQRVPPVGNKPRNTDGGSPTGNFLENNPRVYTSESLSTSGKNMIESDNENTAVLGQTSTISDTLPG